MVFFQVLDKVDAKVYPFRLEIHEVEPSSIVGRPELAREIHQFCQRPADLWGDMVRQFNDTIMVVARGEYSSMDTLHIDGLERKDSHRRRHD